MAMEKVVSFHITGHYIHEVLPIIFDNSFPGQYKVPLYYKTSKQLLSLDSITGIILPANINDAFPRNDYSPMELVKRIRLLSDDKKARLPIFIPEGSSEDFNENLLAGVYFGKYSPKKTGVRKLDYDTIVNSLGNQIPLEEHDISNLWAPYRLAQLLDYFGISYLKNNELENLKDCLQEKCFFQKLIREESIRQRNNTIRDEEIDDFKSKLENIRSRDIHIGIIDDEINSGWGLAYQAFFGKINIEFLYPPLSQNDMNNSAKRESNFDSFMYKLSNADYNINKYDLIILDLRLYEKSTHNSKDILDIKNISGNKILNFLKSTSPALPVIMCTASNKFWSYNMARSFGADGFWSKESPQYGVAFDYQFYNTYNFIKMTYSVMKWSSNIRPIYEAMEEIASCIDDKIISERIKHKLNTVFSQLHISRSKFIENQFGQSGLTTAYLAVHSLVNEVLDLKNIRKDKSYFVELSGKEIKFCIKEENKFNLTEEVINQLKILKKYRYYQGSNIFPDRDFINYVLQKSGNGELRKNYNQYNWIRNNLPIIHRRKSKTHNIKITLKDLMGYLAIFYRIFLNKECKFLIYKK